MIIAAIIGALINLFGSQVIKVSFGLQKTIDLNAQNLILTILDILVQITIGVGLVALTVASLPAAVLAFFLYAAVAATDFIIFWEAKNEEHIQTGIRYV